MGLFFVKKAQTIKRAALSLLLFAILLFVSCEQPAGQIKPAVDAQVPLITTQPSGGGWDVSSRDAFEMNVTAVSFDGGTLSYQWYSAPDESAEDGTILSGKTNAVISLEKPDYASDGKRYFYVVVTNSINDNGDGGVKTASVVSSAAGVTITGNVSISIYTPEDMAKIGVAATHPLSGTYILMNDITLENWKPIIGSDNEEAFSGKFNGNNKTITLNSFDSSFVGTYSYNGANIYEDMFLGIFGAVKGTSASAKAEIKNLNIHSSVDIKANQAAKRTGGTAAGSNITGPSGVAVGLLTGYAELALIDNITLSGSFKYDYNGGGNVNSAYLGGIAGFIIGNGTTVKNCTSTMEMDIKPGYGGGQLVPGSANTFSWVGGIVGFFKDGAGIEKCHNTGAVCAISDVSASQVLVGGILGGSHYSFASDPHGYIEDCSSTGNITVSARGFWPMAGGIAGVVAGGSSTLEGSTRIVRCFATGTILNASAGGAGQWPYLGGIVGYIYVGARVSQCYFNGTVINEKPNDYSGGIAGYSSYATGYVDANNNPCLIEDCWSAGVVRGYNNAGGIVGQNQQNTLLKRSYSLMDVFVTNNANGPSSAAQWGIGGIVGSHSSTRLTDAMEACVALNISIYAAKGDEIHRIAGRMQAASGVFPIMTNVYALPELVPVTDDTSKTYVADKGLDRPDGEDIPATYLSGGKPTKEFYEFIGWDFVNVWKMGSDGYPKLKWQ
jgi:hypothetical protein